MTGKEQPQVILRAMEPEDLDLLYRIENDFDLWAVGATNVPYSRYALHEYMASATNDIYADRQVRLMIEGINHEVIGILDLMDFNPQHERAEVGIVIQRRFRGNGYGKAAMGQLVAYAHSVLHLHQLYAFVSVDNVLCIRLFEGLGFERSSVLKAWLYDGDTYHDAVVMQFFL